MVEQIQASMLSDVTSFLKQLSDVLFKAIDKLCDVGMMKDVKKNEDGGVDAKLFIDDEEAKISITPNKDNKNASDVVIIPKGKSKITLKNIPNKNFQDELVKTLKEVFPNAEFKNIQSAHTLCVGLHKVTSSRDVCVECRRITANYDNTTALMDLNTLLDSPEFVDVIPEGDTEYYQITDTGDDFYIDTVDEFEIDDVSPDYLLNLAYLALMNTLSKQSVDSSPELLDVAHTLLDNIATLYQYTDTPISCDMDDTRTVQDYVSALTCAYYNESDYMSEYAESLCRLLAIWEDIGYLFECDGLED